MADIFLDRDGVINYNRPEHVKSWAEFEFLPGSLAALARLKEAGQRVFVITNQAAVNRRLLSPPALEAIHRQMIEEVARHGGQIEAVLYCPHRPEEGCACRKPRPGLIRQAELYYAARPVGGWLVGDHRDDIEAGLQAGCRPVLVLSGRTPQPPPDRPGLLVAADLREAVSLILAHERALVGPATAF